MKSTTVLLQSIIALICAKNLTKGTKGSSSRRIRIGSIFSGIGGLDLGIERAFREHGVDVEIVFFCERDQDKQKVLQKHWKNVPIYSDILELFLDQNREEISNIDLLIGGFPCQDVSSANTNKQETGGFFDGDRSSLYFAISKLIDKIATMNRGVPPIVIMENVKDLRTQGTKRGGISPLGSIAADMNMKNYVVEYQLLRGCDFGSPQTRRRYFMVCYPCKQDYFDPTTIISNSDTCVDYTKYSSFWDTKNEPPFIVDTNDSTSDTLRYKMVGEAVIPQVAQWVGEQLILSGALNSYAFAGNISQPVFPFKMPNETFELNPADLSTIPLNGAYIWNFTVYPQNSYCIERTGVPTIPTITSMSNMISPSMQKWALNKTARRKAGLAQKQALPNDKTINRNFIEWAGGFPKNWTKV